MPLVTYPELAWSGWECPVCYRLHIHGDGFEVAVDIEGNHTCGECGTTEPNKRSQIDA